MPKFAIKFPYFIIVICLMIAVVGTTMLVRMPVDLFPEINIPVVVVATFYSGMPPEEIETDITGRFERFFTLGSGIEHIESRSLPGVSLIKIYFQPGFDANAAVTEISNLAMADLRKLPPGTLPPVVLKFDASSLPVCLITLKGQGLTETQLRDLGQYNVRNQVASVAGASVPQPFGGKYRQIMVYVDPMKLEAHELSVMDVVRKVNEANLILPSGDVKIGPTDYNIYTNSQLPSAQEIDRVPLKTVGTASVLVGDVGHAEDGHQIQTNIVRVDGQPSVYLPVLKQGGDTNTIQVVDGIKDAVSHLNDVPKSLIAHVVFDQSIFVKKAIQNLLDEGLIGLVLTALMILLFLGSGRATFAVLLSIPLSALAAFMALSVGGGTVNAMVLGGLALAFSRLIDNSVVVLENIFRHMEKGERAEVAAEKGGTEVSLAVLAATLTTAIVFFPVVFLYGVSRFLFVALALAVVLSLFASYFVAMTVVPLFCAKMIKSTHIVHEVDEEHIANSFFGSIIHRFNRGFERLLGRYDRALIPALLKPGSTVLGMMGIFLISLSIFPLLGVSFFPRTDPGQFMINIKAPSGTRLETTERYLSQVEAKIRDIVPKDELDMIVSNIGVTPGFSSMYTSNSGSHTATLQVNLRENHKVGSYEYMDRVRNRLQRDMPELSTYFQTGGLVDAVLNLGLPAPIDLQITSSHLEQSHEMAIELANKIRRLKGVSDVMVPQDVDYPSLRLNIDRERASKLGLSQKEVVDNLITALTSNQMIAPSYWVDPKSGNDYLLTVQYPEDEVNNLNDLSQIPLRSPNASAATHLSAVADVERVLSPTEVDHYKLSRVIDVYVSPAGEDLGAVNRQINDILKDTQLPEGMRVVTRGMVAGMNASFSSFSIGLILAVVLVYLILVAQFQSFMDPFIILLAIPMGITGVLIMLWATGTSVNVMSLMGVVMMVGIVVSNSILIVDFTRRLRADGMPMRKAVGEACKVRLRPVLMTSLATILGLIPMALALGEGSESYAPLARAIIGGLTVSVALTVFIVPAAYLLVHRKEAEPGSDEFEMPTTRIELLTHP